MVTRRDNFTRTHALFKGAKISQPAQYAVASCTF